MDQAAIICFWLLMHWMRRASVWETAKAGKRREAKIAMTAITTNNSIKVKASLQGTGGQAAKGSSLRARRTFSPPQVFGG
jgi:hypothetical protein